MKTYSACRISMLCSALFFLFLFNSSLFFAQEISGIEYDAKKINACTKYRKSAPLLVEMLTKDASTDKEKFDAIFSWVALNISYNYRTYYSNSGTSKPDLKRVLNKKSGICLDYAYLMDSLCELAGIKNYTVVGYSKDEIFDLNDSIYLDDHAWNAVRLDGKWYLYDVTWASGSVNLELTKFATRLVRILRNWPRKNKSIKLSKDKYRTKKDVCDTSTIKGKGETFEFKYSQYRFRFIRKLLMKIKLRYRPVYHQTLDTSFYIGDPEVFAITHYPDNPSWNLIPKKTFNDFVSDSAYYYLTPDVYKTQKINGAVCPECDQIAYYDELQTDEDMLSKSVSSNPKNKFVPFLCYFDIGRIKLLESVYIEDSAKKVFLLDTSIALFTVADKNLELSGRNCGTAFSFQKKKNSEKKKLFSADFKSNTQFAQQIKKTTQKKTAELDAYRKLVVKMGNKYVKRSEGILKEGENIKFENKKNAPMEKELNLKLVNIKRQSDSISVIIDTLRVVANEQIITSSDEIWKKLSVINDFIDPFYNKLFYRYEFYDDYKKEIIDQKKKITRSKDSLNHNFDSTLFSPINSIIANTKKFSDLIEVRNKLSKEQFAILTKLAKINGANENDVYNFKNEWLLNNKDDYCWLKDKLFNINRLYIGCGVLSSYYGHIKIILDKERHQEDVRFRYVNKELARRMYKNKNIIKANKRVCRAALKETKKIKSDYLKELKEKAKQEKANAKAIKP